MFVFLISGIVIKKIEENERRFIVRFSISDSINEQRFIVRFKTYLNISDFSPLIKRHAFLLIIQVYTQETVCFSIREKQFAVDLLQ